MKAPQSRLAGKDTEVDFGQISFHLAGERVIGRMFIIRLSASGKALHCVYANEAQEVFIDGHVRAFENFGGVPWRIRYDNLKPVVIRVLKGGDRKESERFIAMRSHYGFDFFLCLPARQGWNARERWSGGRGWPLPLSHLVPSPKVDTLAELNELIALVDERDDARHIMVPQHHLDHAVGPVGPCAPIAFTSFVRGSLPCVLKSRTYE